MSINGRGETTSEVRRDRPEDGFLDLLRVAAVIAVLAGAGSSVGLMLHAGRHNDSRILLVLFAIWVLSPFMALVLANVVSKRWSVLRRATLYSVTLVLTFGSLAIYGDVALGPPRAKPAFVFVVVPLASWLFISLAVTIAALISGKLSRRGDGA
jgi:phosphate/sulfate permease